MSTGRKLRIFLVVTLLFVSLCLLAWGLVPFGTESLTVPFAPDDIQIPTPSGTIPWRLIFI